MGCSLFSSASCSIELLPNDDYPELLDHSITQEVILESKNQGHRVSTDGSYLEETFSESDDGHSTYLEGLFTRSTSVEHVEHLLKNDLETSAFSKRDQANAISLLEENVLSTTSGQVNTSLVEEIIDDADEILADLSHLKTDVKKIIKQEVSEAIETLTKCDDTSATFSCLDGVWGIVSAVTFLADLISDLFLSSTMSGDPAAEYWSMATLLLVLIPTIIQNLFSIYWYWFDETQNSSEVQTTRKRPVLWFIRIMFHLLLLAPVLRQLEMIYYGVKSLQVDTELPKAPLLTAKERLDTLQVEIEPNKDISGDQDGILETKKWSKKPHEEIVDIENKICQNKSNLLVKNSEEGYSVPEDSSSLCKSTKFAFFTRSFKPPCKRPSSSNTDDCNEEHGAIVCTSPSHGEIKMIPKTVTQKKRKQVVSPTRKSASLFVKLKRVSAISSDISDETQNNRKHLQEFNYYALWLHAEGDSAALDLIGTLLQDAPQIVLQLYIMTKTYPSFRVAQSISLTMVIQLISISISLATMSWTITEFIRAVRLPSSKLRSLSIADLVILVVMHFTSITPQVGCFALLASKHMTTCIVFILGHWFMAFLVIFFQLLWLPITPVREATFSHDEKKGKFAWLDDAFFSAIFGAIFLFTFVDVDGTAPLFQSVLFAILRLIEETTFLLLWYFSTSRSTWWHLLPFILMPIFFVISLSSTIVFYKTTGASLMYSRKTVKRSKSDDI